MLCIAGSKKREFGEILSGDKNRESTSEKCDIKGRRKQETITIVKASAQAS
jgi:hypothetical protein